tara:strand:- start:465 stop:893 length:429 start_codon:yes stop_codon:yes gene_type:complete
MGDRVSIIFKDKDNSESPVLCHHWGGTEFPKYACQWFKKFSKDVKTLKKGNYDPLSRLEASNVLVQFISDLKNHKELRYITKFETDDKYNIKQVEYASDWITHSIYLGKSRNDVDDSDNGCYTITTHNGRMYNENGEEIAVK